MKNSKSRPEPEPEKITNRKKIRPSDFCRITKVSSESALYQLNWIVRVMRISADGETATVSFYLNSNLMSVSSAIIPVCDLKRISVFPTDKVIAEIEDGEMVDCIVAALVAGMVVMREGFTVAESALKYITYTDIDTSKIRFAGSSLWLDGETEHAPKDRYNSKQPKVNINSGDAVLPLGGLNQVKHNLINIIPVHDVYIGLFAGKDAVFRNIDRAANSILVDCNPKVIEWWKLWLKENKANEKKGVKISISSSNAMQHWLDSEKMRMRFINGERIFYLIDPPYLPDTRAMNLQYEYELTPQDHVTLVDSCIQFSRECRNVFLMLCTFGNVIYNSKLPDAGWHRKQFKYVTRTGVKILDVWTNYNPDDILLHDTKYVGNGWDNRRMIKRKISRAVEKFKDMDKPQRQAILTELFNQFKSELTQKTA